MMIRRIAVGALLVLMSSNVAADDLYNGSSFSSLSADQRAGQVGDIVTVIVSENNTASNRVGSGSRKRQSLNGQISAGDSLNETGGLSFGGEYSGEGTNSRNDRMLARLSVTVTEVLPNGDLLISGTQNLNINGETTHIKVSGRIRPYDIDGQNAVLSSRIADAVIDYNGKGFATRGARPGIITRIFNWLGLS
ncbi:flagellar basal body L-ring protein FlgH [Sphingorhabdus arenilitoris]|uniref:Flagellar L-ring protein n=1 Tax=Sphingorhabdus arenilitoris TaxID=1490041 RepID=A0ABV8RFQ3_9SPHN